MMINKLMLTGGALAFLGMLATSDGAVLVTLHDTAPTDGIIAEFSGTRSSAIGWLNKPLPSSNRSNVGFAFYNESAAIMTGFGVYATYSEGGALEGEGGNITIHIREFSELPTGNLANTPPAGSTYATYTAVIDVEAFSVGADGAPKVLNFDLGGEFDLKADHYYSIQLQWTGLGANQRFSIAHNETTGDPADISVGSWDGTGTTWTRRNSRDYLFYATGAHVIPEPSTYALLGLSAAALTLYRRRKK